jgi:cytochrome c peroxidase
MIEAGWEGFGVDWDGRVDAAPPRCLASCRRAESSLRTPGARKVGITRPFTHKAIGCVQQGRASTRCT